MKGKYRIIVENKKIRYDFEVKRNITIILRFLFHQITQVVISYPTLDFL